MIFSTVAECISKQSIVQIQFTFITGMIPEVLEFPLIIKYLQEINWQKVDQNMLNQDAPKEDNGGIRNNNIFLMVI